MIQDGDPASPDTLFAQLHNLHMVASVARCGSVSGAARDLCRSPSVVTRGVAEVEGVLGIDLFERKPGRFTPNWYGGLLVERIRRIEDEIAAEIADAGRGRNGPSTAALRHLLYNGRKLLLLIQLDDARSATGAAGAMDMTQSGISMALSRLEEALGLRLFYRNLHGLTPTDAGARLILRARRIRAELRHVLSDMASVDGTPSGLVVVGALPLARSDMLPRAIAACLDHAAGVQIDAVEAAAAILINRLRSGEIDIVLTVPGTGFDPKGLVVEPLFGDSLIVVAGAGHALADRRDLALGDLADQHWILPGRHSDSRKSFDEQWARADLLPPRPVLQTADLSLIRQLLLQRRDMVALTSRALLQHELNSGVLIALDVGIAPITRGVVMLRREAAMHSPAVNAMVDALRAQAHYCAAPLPGPR